MKFKADYNGSVTGIRFYKAAANTGTHIGSLWTAAGTRLAQATFTNETRVRLADGRRSRRPVAVTAGTTYVASYFAPNGHYSVDRRRPRSAVDNAPLHALAQRPSANGVYAYGAASAFPSNTYNAANYWVDVLYAAAGARPGHRRRRRAAAGSTSATVTWTAPSSGGPVTLVHGSRRTSARPRRRRRP